MPPIARGQVYFVNLGPTVGREQGGRRPVVVVSTDALNFRPLVISVIPGTRREKAPMPYPWNVLVAAGEGNLERDTVFLTFQMRALDASRFKEPLLGVLSSSAMAKIERGLAYTLSIPASACGIP
jgi:mRNA interferase MazF